MAENKSAFPGFIGPSYVGRSKRFDSQRAVNMYIEADETPGAGQVGFGKNQQNFVYIGTPGLEFLQTIGTGPIRAVYTISDLSLTMVVSGNQVFQLSGTNAVPVALSGNLNTSSGPVSVADNGIQVIFVDGQFGYYFTIGATTGSIESFNTLIGGSGYFPGTGSNVYTGIGLTGGTGTGATADITVAAGVITAVTIVNPGSGYLVSDILSVDPLFDSIGLGSGFSITVSVIASGPFLAYITSPNFYPAATVTFQDGYFILNQVGTNLMFISDTYSVDFLAQNQAGKAGNSDILMGLISVNRQLYLIGARTLEIWWNAGASGSTPFQRQDGRFSQYGLAAPATLAVIQESFMWLSSNAQGGGIVCTLQNAMPVRTSTHAIEFMLQNAGDLSKATAYSYQEEGHWFYCLNVPGLTTTLVYDAATNLWHERQSTINGNIGRHLGENHAYLNGTHIIGDYNSGNIYAYNLDYYTDNGNPLYRIRQTPHVSKSSNNIFFWLMDVDFQFGVGLVNDGVNTQSNVSPTCTLLVSKDGGETFGNPIQGTLGKIGAYRTRCRFSRCGYGRDLVFKLVVTDAVEFQMLSAMCDLEVGDL